MVNGLLDENFSEKNNLEKLMVGARMISVSYDERFHLLFQKNLNEYGNLEMDFSFDAMYWFGNRDEWSKRISDSERNTFGDQSDCLLAYELVRLRYANLIKVKRVDFYDDYFTIEFIGGATLSIAHYSDSDYAWYLEEVSLKREQEKMVIGCQGNQLFQNNIPGGIS